MREFTITNINYTLNLYFKIKDINKIVTTYPSNNILKDIMILSEIF